MAYNARVYRILIASPSDVQELREAAVQVIQRWNDLHSSVRNVVILPVRWETHVAPEYNTRPQETINRQIVDDCDLVVGIFWSRLGTQTGEAASGTLEEIERAAKAGKQVMLYFSHAPMDPYDVESRQMASVKRFRENVESNAIIEPFKSSVEFHNKFADHLEMRLRELQKDDAMGQPTPLDLQFVSLENGQLIGNSMSTTANRLELSDPDKSLDDPLVKDYFDYAFQKARSEAALVPVALAIRNVGMSGIRNLYAEMSITASEGSLQVSQSDPSELAMVGGSMSTFVWHTTEPSEAARKLERLSAEGLSKEGDEWKYSFTWDAIQPQRKRYVQPFTFLTVLENCKAKFRAKVYAENFANPIVLQAEVAVAVQPRIVESDVIVGTAKHLAEEARRSTLATTVGGWNRLSTLRTLSSGNIHTD